MRGQQQGQMVVVPAASPSNSAPAPATATAPASANSSAAIKILQQMKAANAETLKKQEATLQQLEDLQKAAEQIKILAHRT